MIIAAKNNKIVVEPWGRRSVNALLAQGKGMLGDINLPNVKESIGVTSGDVRQGIEVRHGVW